MVPGILDQKLTVRPLARVSPSRYGAMKQCNLREVWASGGEPNLLPTAPAARVGTVIHRLFEDAGKARLTPAERVVIERRWDELIGETESRMTALWLERHFVPLRSSVPQFEVRRLRAEERALALAQEAGYANSESSHEKIATGLEKWVETPDGSVGGYIDHVVASEHGPVLRDYKSGMIHDPTVGRSGAIVRKSLVEQMHLYAALYAASTGSWPAKLELVPLCGNVVEIAFDAASCKALLTDAITVRERINTVIAQIPSLKRGIEAELASPDGTSCRQCLFRPACRPYRHSRHDTSVEQWPNDIWGHLSEMRQLGNGTLLVTIRNTVGVEQRVRGLAADPARHPALQHAHDGDLLGFFNVKGAAVGGTFGETPWTVIYKIQGHVDG